MVMVGRLVDLPELGVGVTDAGVHLGVRAALLQRQPVFGERLLHVAGHPGLVAPSQCSLFGHGYRAGGEETREAESVQFVMRGQG